MTITITPQAPHSKVNVIERLEFELAFYNVALQNIIQYITETPPLSLIYSHFYIISSYGIVQGN